MTDVHLDDDLRLLAAVAYGESSAANDSEEIGGVAYAVANRARAWGKSITAIRKVDPNYAYAWSGSNQRFNLLMNTPLGDIQKDGGMKLALEWAKKAMKEEGVDPSNGAFWWDGVDFETNYKQHRKVLDGFAWGNPSDNIFGVPEHRVPVIIYWKMRNKKTGRVVKATVRGRYDAVWISTAAHGKTIFWKHNIDFIKATGCKPYK